MLSTRSATVLHFSPNSLLKFVAISRFWKVNLGEWVGLWEVSRDRRQNECWLIKFKATCSSWAVASHKAKRASRNYRSLLRIPRPPSAVTRMLKPHSETQTKLLKLNRASGAFCAKRHKNLSWLENESGFIILPDHESWHLMACLCRTTETSKVRNSGQGCNQSVTSSNTKLHPLPTPPSLLYYSLKNKLFISKHEHHNILIITRRKHTNAQL